MILAVFARDEAPSKRKLDGQVTKFEANLAAIETPRQLEVGRCQLTAVERVKLVRHTGWGGLPASFDLDARTRPGMRARSVCAHC